MPFYHNDKRLFRQSLLLQVLAAEMGLPVGRLRAFGFAYACLSASWPDKPQGSAVKDWLLMVARNAGRQVGLGS